MTDFHISLDAALTRHRPGAPTIVNVLAIDPGNTESAYVIIDANCRPVAFDKLPNDQLLDRLMSELVGDDPTYEPTIAHVAIEMIASYGMPVGADVFETCVWIGRYQQTVDTFAQNLPCDLVKRHPVKVHHCHDSKAKDSNIAQALVDRFAHGIRNHGKGTKAEPGWFYGFHSDIWQAYALAVYVADTRLLDSVAAATPSPVRDAAATVPSTVQGALL